MRQYAASVVLAVAAAAAAAAGQPYFGPNLLENGGCQDALSGAGSPQPLGAPWVTSTPTRWECRQFGDMRNSDPEPRDGDWAIYAADPGSSGSTFTVSQFVALPTNASLMALTGYWGNAGTERNTFRLRLLQNDQTTQAVDWESSGPLGGSATDNTWFALTPPVVLNTTGFDDTHFVEVELSYTFGGPSAQNEFDTVMLREYDASDPLPNFACGDVVDPLCGTNNNVNGDGSAFSCSCSGDFTCVNNECVCGDPVCPAGTCGRVYNSCGNYVDCPACPGIEECSTASNLTATGFCFCPPADQSLCVYGSTCGNVSNACGSEVDCEGAPGYANRLDCNDANTDRTCNEATGQCDCDAGTAALCTLGDTCNFPENQCGNSFDCQGVGGFGGNRLNCNDAATDRTCNTTSNQCDCDPVLASECVRGTTCGVFTNNCGNSFDCANALGFSSSTDCDAANTDRTCNPTNNQCECDVATASLCTLGSTCNRPENKCGNSFDCRNAGGFGNNRLNCNDAATDRTCNTTSNECDCDDVPTSMCTYGTTCGTYTNNCGNSLSCGSLPAYSNNQDCNAANTDRTCSGNTCVCDTVPASECNPLGCGRRYNKCNNFVNCGTSRCINDRTCNETDLTREGICECDPATAALCTLGSTCNRPRNLCGNEFDCAGAPGFSSDRLNCDNTNTDRSCNLTTHQCDCDPATAAVCLPGTCGVRRNRCLNTFDCALTQCGADEHCDALGLCECDFLPLSLCTTPIGGNEACGRFTNACNATGLDCTTACPRDETCNADPLRPNQCICDPVDRSVCDGPDVCGLLNNTCQTIDCRGCNRDETCGADNRCTCDAVVCLPGECGLKTNACGRTENCGGCPNPQYCSLEGICTCDLETCESQGKNCGLVSDTCNGTLSCGSCPPPGNYTANPELLLETFCSADNVCIDPNCYPFTSCANESWACTAENETLWTGCANVTCGSCPALVQICNSDHQCECLPRTSCEAANRVCGSLYDGCVSLDCGTCPENFECTGDGICNQTVFPDPPAAETLPGQSADEFPVWVIILVVAVICVGAFVGAGVVFKKRYEEEKAIGGGLVTVLGTDIPGVKTPDNYGSVAAVREAAGGNPDVVIYGQINPESPTEGDYFDMSEMRQADSKTDDSPEVVYGGLGDFREQASTSADASAGGEDDDDGEGVVVYTDLSGIREAAEDADAPAADADGVAYADLSAFRDDLS